MGCFSWMCADTDNKESLHIGEEAYVPCPDGRIIYEPCYGGYGTFGEDNEDIFVLVVEWNKDYLNEEMIRKPQPEQWGLKEDGSGDEAARKYYEQALKRYDTYVLIMNDISNGMTKEEMKDEYGWNDDQYTFAVRLVGIAIACDDEQNSSLKYPIKICKEKPESYESVKISSNADPDQGFF